MPALIKKPSSFVSQKLIELLAEAAQPRSDDWASTVGDRLDAMEVEVFENCMPDAMLVMVRATRDALEFAERIMSGSRRAVGTTEWTGRAPFGCPTLADRGQA